MQPGSCHPPLGMLPHAQGRPAPYVGGGYWGLGGCGPCMEPWQHACGSSDPLVALSTSPCSPKYI